MSARAAAAESVSAQGPLLVLALFVAVGGAGGALAQDAGTGGGALERIRSAPLEVSLTPYIWATAIDGTVGVANFDADVNASFGDILSNLNGALMLSVELRKGPVALLSDTVLAKLEDDASATTDRERLDATLKADATADMVIQQLAGTYRLGTWSFANSEPGRPFDVTVDPYIGGRYTYLNTEVQGRLNTTVQGPLGLVDRSAQRQATQSADKHWVDPIIGLRTIWNLGGRFSLVVAGDIGGISTSDQYSWQAWSVVGYHFGLFGENNAAFLVGYRALHQKFEDGSGNRRFDWDVTIHGPIAGLKILF